MIYCVEDDAGIRELVVYTLQNTGMEARGFSDGAALTAASQNVEECLKSETARLMFANSEFLLLFNQAATDRAELSKLLHISDTQLSYITNAEAGHGLLRMGGSIVPFVNTIPRQTELYKLMTTTPGESR